MIERNTQHCADSLSSVSVATMAGIQRPADLGHPTIGIHEPQNNIAYRVTVMFNDERQSLRIIVETGSDQPFRDLLHSVRGTPRLDQ